MNKQIKQLAALSALALLGATSARASVIAGNAAGGSEAVLSLVNTVGDSISQDLGLQMAGINASSDIALSAGVLSFISDAGGAANVTFGVIAGNTTARTYLHSSANATFLGDPDQSIEPVVVGNGAKGLWSSTIDGLVVGLNFGDATPISTNLTYGPYVAATSGTQNYVNAVYDTWQSGDFQFSNLAGALDTLYLYTTTFAIANTGTVPFTAFNGGLSMKLDLNSNQLLTESTTAVPAPAAVWLLGTALVPLARRAFRKSRNPA